jgi:hypothetical protein
LWSTLWVSGLVVLARAFFGPFEFLVSVRSPLNAQSIFGLSLILSWVLGQSRDRAPATERAEPVARSAGERKRDALCCAGLFVIAMAAFGRSLSFFFLSDEFVLIDLAQSFGFPYLVQIFTEPSGDGFFRPLGYISLGLDALWADGDPARWRSVSLGLHVLNSCLVYTLAKRFELTRGAAFLSASLFLMHGTRPEAAVWIAARFDLLAALFSLSTVLLFARYLDKRSARDLSLSVLCCGLALLSKEVAFFLPVMLLLLTASRKKERRDSLRALLPFVVLTGTVFAYRWWLLGGIGGYVDVATGRPEVLQFDVLSLAKVFVLRLWAILCFPLNSSVEPALVTALAAAAGVASMLWLARARLPRRQFLLGLAWTVLFALPAGHQLLIGPDLEKSRLLYLPSVGFALLLGLAVSQVPLGRNRRLIAAGLLVFHFTVLQHNLAIWSRVATTAENTCRTAGSLLAPTTKEVVAYGLPGSLDGVYFFRNGFGHCLERQARRRLDSVEVLPAPSRVSPSEERLVLKWDRKVQNVEEVLAPIESRP